MKLTSLHLNAFRGATKPLTLNFSQDKNITLIYAENGNGKSTIADAMVCLCTEGVGSLGDKSSTDRSFLKSVGFTNSDLRIELITDAQAYKATLSTTSNKFVKTHSSDLPKLSALRRAQVTSFIEDSASERYKVLSAFIDISKIEKSESELKKLVRDVGTDLDRNTKSLTDAKDTLQEIWTREGQPEGSLEKWAESEILKDITETSREHAANKKVVDTWHVLKNIIDTIQTEKPNYDQAIKDLKKAEDDLIVYKVQNPLSESELLSLLNETQKFLNTKESIDKCPVCEKESEKDQLLGLVANRINRMQEFNRLTQSRDYCKGKQLTLHNRLEGQIEPFNKKLKEFKTFTEPLTGFEFTELLKSVSLPGDTKENYKLINDAFPQLLIEIEKLNTHSEKLNKSISQHNLIKSNHESITRLTAKCEELQKLLTKSEEALKVLENTRKSFIDTEHDSISGEVEAMYQDIHPNESLGGVKLFLNPKFQGSLNLTATFHSETDITPQSVYSESHLDTLGICIFIALAKKESQKDLILVLDDVVMSVDEQHLDRIIDLIHSQSKYFAHVFISTHYRPWRERYRNNRAPNSNIQFIELRAWSLERGITIAKPQFVLEEIKNYLADPANFHRENLSGASGRFLEALLDFLTYNFQSRLKRKSANDFTLSELLDALSKDLLKVLKVQKMAPLEDGSFCKTIVVEEIELKPVIDEIKALKAVRNQVGAHFTFPGALVSDKDIEEFAKSTVKLAELLICPVNGNLPDRKPSGSYWETKSGAIRLFPLIEP